MDSPPAYLKLFRSGELQSRAQRALEALADCALCPRACHADRVRGAGKVCRTGRQAVVSSAFPHFGEERCLTGTNGSGTIFFGWCNLGCAFCQNWELSAEGEGREVTAGELAELMLQLQERGCHNVNLVSPSHVVPQILEALAIAAGRGLCLPLVYNTGGYDTLEALAVLDGIIDIYMPDFKFWDSEPARRFAKAPDYPQVVRNAIREMHRQVGTLALDEHGMARRGVLLRHLVMPGGVAGTRSVMEWVANEIGPDTYVNLMAQYHPAGRAAEFPELARTISAAEFKQALEDARSCGLHRLDRGSLRSLR